MFLSRLLFTNHPVCYIIYRRNQLNFFSIFPKLLFYYTSTIVQFAWRCFTANIFAAFCVASPDPGWLYRNTCTLFFEESNDLRNSAADVSANERGVISRPKSVCTRRFRDDRNHGLSGTQGRKGVLELVPAAPGMKAGVTCWTNGPLIARPRGEKTICPHTHSNRRQFRLVNVPNLWTARGSRADEDQTNNPSCANRSVSPNRWDAAVSSLSRVQSLPLDPSKATPASSHANEEPMKCHNTWSH